MNADTSNISTFSQWHPILTDLLNVNSLAVKSQRYLQLDNPLSICSLGLPGPTATQVLLFPHFISHCTASLMVFIITCRPIDSCCEIRDFILSWRPSAVPLPAEDVPISQLKVSPTCHGDPPTWGYTVVVFFFLKKKWLNGVKKEYNHWPLLQQSMRDIETKQAGHPCSGLMRTCGGRGAR